MSFDGKATVGTASVKISGDGDFLNDLNRGSLSISAHASGKTVKFAMLVDGLTYYVSSDSFSRTLPAGKSWVSVDVRSQAKSLGLDVSQYSEQSPAEILTRLRHIGTVSTLGVDKVDGVEATHYRAVIDVKKLPGSARLVALLHPVYQPLEVWISGDNLVRRVKMGFSGVTQGKRFTEEFTEDFSKFGEDVGVEFPAASATLTAANLRKLVNQGCTKDGRLAACK